MDAAFPSTADVIIIGGGVAGLSTAMQLSERGSRVVVVERERLGNGSTGRAAGLLGQLRGTAAATEMLMDGVRIVEQLEQRSGVEIFVKTGSLRIAATPERAQEIQDLVAMGQSIGFDICHLDQGQVAEKLPYMRTDDVLDACFCPTDGHLQPAELVSAYIQLGRKNGVEYLTACPVERLLISGGKVTGVETAKGTIHAPVVVNAGGPWSYLLAEMADTRLPTAALGHVYLTTRPDPENPVDRLSPAIRDRHLRLYARPESGGLIVGMYGEECMKYDMKSLPADYDMSAIKPRQDDLFVAILIDAAQKRYPWITPTTPMTITAGIMTFTPDGKPFCGTMPDLEGLYYCAGFCGHGIVQSPAIGLIMAQMILDGETTYDIRAIEADRFFEMDGFSERTEIEDRCYQMQGSYYGKVEGGQVER